ncbi:MAG TPA: hypothetical protein DCE44_05610 [Verrucomicrobiales bacterium]|nr:hypothetical protein [Verrucomicrobiales bacterium]
MRASNRRPEGGPSAHFFAAAEIFRAQTGVVLDPLQPDAVWLWAPAALIGLGALAGIIPALKAYGADVAAGLAPES